MIVGTETRYPVRHSVDVTPGRSPADPTVVSCSCGWREETDRGTQFARSQGYRHLAQLFFAVRPPVVYRGDRSL